MNFNPSDYYVTYVVGTNGHVIELDGLRSSGPIIKDKIDLNNDYSFARKVQTIVN